MKFRIYLCSYLILFLSMLGCEISTSVPFDLPKYKEELIIHAVASPQSGARALIKYSQPITGYPGEAPEFPAFNAWLTRDGYRTAQFKQDSISIIEDNEYSVQTIFLSISTDSLFLEVGQSYTMEVLDLTSQDKFESSSVTVPPKPVLEEFELDCSGSECSVTSLLGPVEESVYAISVKGKVPDTVLMEDYYIKRNNQVFSNDLIFPETNQWQQYAISSVISHGYRRHPFDSLSLPVDLSVSISYLSYDIAQLIREIYGTHAIGEDIFQALRPFHSNFNTADTRVFGVFGLYNENIRTIQL